MQNRRRIENRKIAAAVFAVTATMLGALAPVQAGDSGSMVTVSTSGSTALRNWIISDGFSALPAGAATLTLSNGNYVPNPNPPPPGGLQLAPSPFTNAVLAGAAGTTGTGIRFEWHEQGSVEGILELVNDQVGYAGGFAGPAIVDPTTRVQTTANPVRINRNIFGTGVTSLGGYGLASTSYNIYDTTASGYNPTTGSNLGGGQNRVQMAFSDVVAVEGFAKTSGTTPAGGTPIFGLHPGETGYGKGNNLLFSPVLNGVGVSGGRQQLVDDDLLNMKTTTPNPNDSTGTNTFNNYGVGSWNTNGALNVVNKTVGITATVFAANPGTGLTQLNKGDAQWLQTTGRLQNGVDFNVTERDVNSGTRNVAALNTGVDGSWAVGDNDAGNGNNTGGLLGDGNAQASIGDQMKFSGKTAGGAQLRPTVQNNRMAVGPLGLSDARSGSAASSITSNFPIRALAYSNTATDAGATFVKVSAQTITDGTYVVWQKEQAITVRTPDANYNNDGIAKGDANGNAIKFRDNFITSVTNFPNPTSVNNPADALLTNSFVLPQMMLWDKTVDGAGTTNVSAVVVNGMTHAQWQAALLGDSTAKGRFDVQDAINMTAGSGSQYGVAPVNGGNSTLGAGVASILITAQNGSGTNVTSAGAVGGNYMFGNFNQTGVRDFDAVKKAQAAQAALYSIGGDPAVNAKDAGISNLTAVNGISTALDNMNQGTGPSKGDLIVLGDYNGDGKFNGKDLYYMARGAAVSDASGTGFTNGTLTATNLTFGDKIRSAQLRKNAALDWMQSNATAQQKLDARANVVNDPTGANSFNKLDVNRDGLVNRADAQVVDHFVGSNYTNINDQLNAVIAAENGTVLDQKDTRGNAVTETAAPISLVDAELDDNGAITATLVGGTSDFKLIRDTLLGTSLLNGDANFDGVVNVNDLVLLANHWLSPADRWSSADFDLNGVVDAHDLGLMAVNWLGNAASLGAAVNALGLPASAVPEPTSLALLAAAPLLLRRRR